MNWEKWISQESNAPWQIYWWENESLKNLLQHGRLTDQVVALGPTAGFNQEQSHNSRSCTLIKSQLYTTQ